ncbi:MULTISPECIES: beta-ketoacyl-ACP synthase III [Clostridium]|uniref:Beta-ketoacyl-[acyl-carrier-protein] synthase III n=3 Tax=Clostridium butyricum TaxID=1492 RepID=C4IHP2_CLOBU|nr:MULTISPECIES: beta-ketoacyl-ACP synthase III [Clostridium]APF21764.1 3-oxoacyl-[acyl-carrier-] synthase III family protein [Clostridium butyricum]EEP54922.1 3-oxoacyl-[acyl-carrier-protein] synthase 3 [Clostridium butyricum E4 str. BoNT E BL5262]ENZ35907.1 3-oxoacyl-[acyl-carrier-protein] synthase 3 [Clostridium butyricum 60E.3]KQB79403.1 3-oxoacyl-ACP synthase [Clostridium butyricum]MBO1684944.1 ketoacyl-ACP synthase III [Clostridium butyricum]
MSNVGIAGTGAYVPSLAVTNDDISELVETNDEWIMKRTGIRERRISQGEDTSDMASKAALCALERADVDPRDVDLIIVATISPDMFIPSVACLVQSKIGADDAACFDINVACSGFVYAMEIAQSMMKSMNYKNALIIGSETLSKVINWKDRSTCILFGDGAGAAVLQRTEEPGIIKSYLKSEGKKGDALTIGAADFNTPFSKESVERDRHIYMNGGDVLKFAVNALADSVNKVLDETGLSMDDIKYIVPHQANVRIIQSAAKKLHTDLDKFYINLERYGNTSSASVPIALNEMYEKGMLKKGDKFILVAFGGGLTYAATMIEW